MSLFSSIVSFFGAKKKGKAASQAAAAQIAAQQQGLDYIRQQQAATQAALAPYTEAGAKALTGSSNLLGLNGGAVQQSSIDNLQNSPLYQSIFRTGQEAVLQNASATGGLRGGNTQRGLANFGADTLASVIQQQLAGYTGLQNLGANVGSDLGQLGASAANSIAGLYGAQGTTRAGGVLAKAEAGQQQLTGLGNIIQDAIAAYSGAGSLGQSAGKVANTGGGINIGQLFKAIF